MRSDPTREKYLPAKRVSHNSEQVITQPAPLPVEYGHIPRMNVRPHGCWLLTHSTCLSLAPASNFRWQVPSALFFFSQPPETGVHRKDRQTGHIRESASPGRDLSGEVWKPGTSSSVLPTVSQGPQPFSTLGTNSSHQLLPFPGPHPPSLPTLLFSALEPTTWALILHYSLGNPS